MTANGWFQILFFFGAVLLVTVPLGAFMYRVLEGGEHFLGKPLAVSCSYCCAYNILTYF